MRVTSALAWRGRAGSAQAPALKALRRRMQIVFQDPYSSLEPAPEHRTALVEPMRVHGIAAGPNATGAPHRCWRRSGCRERARPLPARVLRRPAPAHRHRPRAHGGAGADRGRRTGLRARCLGPGAGAAAAATSCRSAAGSPSCLSATTSAVVRWFCARVAVMYLGRIVEEGPAAARVRSAAASLYADAARRLADPGPGAARRAAAGSSARSLALPRRRRLPLPSALRACHPRLHDECAAAARTWPRPSRRLPARRRIDGEDSSERCSACLTRTVRSYASSLDGEALDGTRRRHAADRHPRRRHRAGYGRASSATAGGPASASSGPLPGLLGDCGRAGQSAVPADTLVPPGMQVRRA